MRVFIEVDVPVRAIDEASWPTPERFFEAINDGVDRLKQGIEWAGLGEDEYVIHVHKTPGNAAASILLDAMPSDIKKYDQALQLRRRVLSGEEQHRKLVSVYAGTRVKTKNTLSPKKIQNLVGTVTDIVTDRVKGEEVVLYEVTFDDPPDSQWRGARLRGTSFDIIES